MIGTNTKTTGMSNFETTKTEDSQWINQKGPIHVQNFGQIFFIKIVAS